MWMDPQYYCLYYSYRPNKAWWLISFPYYKKYTKPRDSTWFWHININIPQLLKDNHTAYMIQGSVSLNEENTQNYTILVKGFHQNIADWWKELKWRDLQTDGFIHKLEASDKWNKDNIAKYSDFVLVLCYASDVRITCLDILHSSTSLASIVQRTMLLWYIKVQSDLKNLKVTEAGTVQEVVKHHKDLMMSSKSPSNYAARYSTTPYCFLTVVEINIRNPLSDTLISKAN